MNEAPRTDEMFEGYSETLDESRLRKDVEKLEQELSSALDSVEIWSKEVSEATRQVQASDKLVRKLSAENRKLKEELQIRCEEITALRKEDKSAILYENKRLREALERRHKEQSYPMPEYVKSVLQQ